MKKRILGLIFVFMMIPCLLVFSACGKKSDKKEEPTPTINPQEQVPEIEVVVPKIEEVSVKLVDDHGFDYDAETNTISFVYGTSIELLKDKFILTAEYDDDTTIVVEDFEIDTTNISGVPNVGTYSVEFKHENKVASINVEITKKPIERLSSNGWTEQTIFQHNEDILGNALEQGVSVKGFDENTMKYTSDSVFKSSQVGVYKIYVIPDENHVWAENKDEGYEQNSEPVELEWQITKACLYMSTPTTLEFEWDGELKELEFIDNNPQNFPFVKFFEIVIDENSKNFATDVGEYMVTIKLKDDKAKNYYIFEKNKKYSARKDDGTGDYKYNADQTQITYYWKIVASV